MFSSTIRFYITSGNIKTTLWIPQQDKQIKKKKTTDRLNYKLTDWSSEHAALMLIVLVLNKVIDNRESEKQQPWNTWETS